MELLIFLLALVVGGLGSMLGIGGGVLLIPLLTGPLGIPIKTAIGASIVSVIATSSAAGAVYVGKGMSHTRLSMILEIATTLGALAGGAGELRHFSPEEIGFTATVANLGALAIENAKLHAALKQRLEALQADSNGWQRFLTLS